MKAEVLGLNSENLETPGLRADSSRLSGLRIYLPRKPGPGLLFILSLFTFLRSHIHLHMITHKRPRSVLPCVLLVVYLVNCAFH